MSRPYNALVRFLISGASGFVGSYLRAYLEQQGHAVATLVRREPRGTTEQRWDPERSELDPAVFEGIEVVVNLNGASIAGQRWTAEYKRTILQSRTAPTALLARSM